MVEDCDVQRMRRTARGPGAAAHDGEEETGEVVWCGVVCGGVVMET